jgi:hypothetical protein
VAQEKTLSSSDQEELRMLYQITVSDLSYFKTQQWNVTYYALLIQAALVGFAKVLSPPLTLLDRSLLAVLSLLAAAAALFVLNKLQRSITVRQSRLDAVRITLGDAFQRAWSAEFKEDHPIQSVYLLRGGIVVTTLLTLWLLTMRLSAT